MREWKMQFIGGEWITGFSWSRRGVPASAVTTILAPVMIQAGLFQHNKQQPVSTRNAASHQTLGSVQIQTHHCKLNMTYLQY